MEGPRTHLVHFLGGQIEHSYDEIRKRLCAAIDAVSQRISVNRSSRIVKWEALLAELSKADPRSVVEQMIPGLRAGTWEHPFADAFRALTEARMFIVIVENLLDELKERELRHLVSGSLHAADDPAHAPGRNYQFELFIGAVGRRAGLALDLVEPDVLVTLKTGPLGLAAKRVRSHRQIEQNIRKAADQIQKSGTRGLILLDVSRIIDPNARAMTHWSRAEQAVGGAVLCLVNKEHPRELKRMSCDLVEGVVLYTAVPLLSSMFRLGTFEAWWPVAVDGKSPAVLHEFIRAFERGASNKDVLISR